MILQIFHELGDEFSGKCCEVKSEKILKKYEKFYDISEYDGKETVEIDYDKYDLVSTIFHETMTDSEKFNKLKEKYQNEKKTIYNYDSTVLYCTVLYCTVLYYTVLYCTVPSTPLMLQYWQISPLKNDLLTNYLLTKDIFW